MFCRGGEEYNILRRLFVYETLKGASCMGVQNGRGLISRIDKRAALLAAAGLDADSITTMMQEELSR